MASRSPPSQTGIAWRNSFGSSVGRTPTHRRLRWPRLFTPTRRHDPSNPAPAHRRRRGIRRRHAGPARAVVLHRALFTQPGTSDAVDRRRLRRPQRA